MNGQKVTRRGKYTGSLPSKSSICFVQDCRSKWLQKLSVPLSFFKIPKVENFPDIHAQWKENLNITRQVSWLRICELHFSPDCFIRDLEAELTGRPIRRRLKNDAIPTLFLSKEENAVKDLHGETLTDIENSQILCEQANQLLEGRTVVNSIVINPDEDKSAQRTVTERPILPKDPTPQIISQNTTSTNCTSTALSLLFHHPTLKPQKDNERYERSDFPEFCKKLEVENGQLQQQVQDLQKKLSLQNQVLQNVKRKYSRRESVVKKLRSDLSALRKEKRKLRHREYMRRVKQKKVAEKRRDRRAWICKQIELGKMDKSSLSLVYSRKSLPFELEQTQKDQEVPKNPTNESTVTIETIVKAVNEIYPEESLN